MKFVYLSSLFMACALSAGAQEASKGIYQFADPGFENWVSTTEPGHGWNSFASARTADLNNSFIESMAKKNSPNPEKVSGRENAGYAVQLQSTSIDISILGIHQKANGNLTTGQINMGSTDPANSKNYNFTNRSSSDHSLLFAGTPDAVTFWAKFTPSADGIQARGKFILHDEQFDYKDPEDESQVSSKIAVAEEYIGKSDWTQHTVKFTYRKDRGDSKQYLLASFTTNPEPGASSGDVLLIDDVYFVYNSELASLKYDGIDIPVSSSPMEIIANNFDVNKVECTSNGRGATIEKKYENSVLTITVKGNDYESTKNSHTYTVNVYPSAEDVVGPYNRWIAVDVMGDLTESANDITISDDDKDNIVNFSLSQFSFGEEDMGAIEVKNVHLNYASDGSIEMKTTEQQTVVIPKLAELMPEFFPTGEVTVDLTGSKKNNVLSADLNILDGFVTVHVGDIPFSTSEENGILTVTGNINSASGAAYVKGESKANVIDLTGATLAKKLNSSNFSAEANNTLYKIADGQTLDGNNVIQNGTCKTLVLTDGLTFNAPEEFTATNVTFNREFTAGNLSTVVLPFSFETANVNGTVYKLESVENGVLSFKSVDGTAEANVPYLVKTNADGKLFNATSMSATVVAKTPETVENSIIGTGVAHVGNFGETMNITSDDQTSWYGYNTNGSFVKVLSGTVKPFRSAIKSTGAAPSSFALKLDGTVTGILNLENPNAKVDVYTVSGVCVRKNVPAASALNGLSRGVYIVGGQKVVK